MFGLSAVFSPKVNSVRRRSVSPTTIAPDRLLKEGNDAAFEYEVHYGSAKSLPKEDVLKLVDVACGKGDAKALNILADHYPDVVDACLVSEKLSATSVGELSYNLLEESAKHKTASSLAPLFTAIPEKGVTKVFGSEDKLKLDHYVESLVTMKVGSSIEKPVGGVIVRNSERDDIAVAQFGIAPTPPTTLRLEPTNSIARNMWQQSGPPWKSQEKEIKFPDHYLDEKVSYPDWSDFHPTGSSM